MNELEFLGYFVGAVITLGGFIAVIWKFTQPINDLKVVIQKLNDNLDVIKHTSDKHEKRLDKHDEHFDTLDGRVGTLETKMNMYHHN